MAATSAASVDRASTKRSVRRADPSWRPAARGRCDGVDDAELRAAAADVDDERLVRDRHALGHADDREERLLLVGQDVQRRAGGAAASWTTRGGVGRAPDRLGPEERDAGRAEARGRVRVAGEGGRQLAAAGAAEEAAVDDRRAEPEEDQFIDQRLQAVAATTATRRWTEFEPRSTDAPTTGPGVRDGSTGVSVVMSSRRACGRDEGRLDQGDLRAGGRVVDRAVAGFLADVAGLAAADAGLGAAVAGVGRRRRLAGCCGLRVAAGLRVDNLAGFLVPVATGVPVVAGLVVAAFSAVGFSPGIACVLWLSVVR